MVLCTPVRAHQLRRKLSPWIQRRRPRLVLLFGSAVTGLQGPEPDLDIAVLFQFKFDHGKIITELKSLLGRDDADVMFLDHADPIARFAACQGRLVYERKTGEFDRFFSLASRQFMDNEKFDGLRRELLDDFLDERLTC